MSDLKDVIASALSIGLEVRFVPNGSSRCMFVLFDSPTRQGVDVEITIESLAHPAAFEKQFLQPAIAQLRR